MNEGRRSGVERRRCMASICVGDDLYIFGGMGASRDEFFNDLWRFRDGQWQLLDKGGVSSPSKRKYASLAGDGRALFLFGGQSEKFHDDLWRYDLESDKWQLISREGPEERYTASLFFYENAFYVFGGCNIQDKKMRFFNDLWRFTDKWEDVTPPTSPAPRYGHCSSLVGGKLYVFGGYSGRNEKDLWVLDVKKLKWNKPRQLWKAPSRRYCGLFEDCGDGRLLLYGGKRWNSKTYNDTWIYDIRRNSWRELRISNPLYRAKMASGSAKDKVYLFGGQNKDNEPLDGVWAFDVNDLRWERIPDKEKQSVSKKENENAVSR